jgi:hypothetical protein
MTSADRSDRGLLLAAVAVLGLVVAPLVHSEQHHRDEHEDEAEAAAVAEAWRAKAREDHPNGHQQGHSHGPAGSGPHGSGALAHLGIALNAAPQLPDVDAVAEEHAAPAAIVAQLRGTLRYLVPEWSQGPPVGC